MEIPGKQRRTMRKIISVALILVLSLALVTSCSATPSTEAPPTSFLREVTSDVTKIYILGSVHVARADLYPLASAIEDAYDDSERLVVEIDVNSENLAKMNELLIEKGMYPPGIDLSSSIPDDLLSRPGCKVETI